MLGLNNFSAVGNLQTFRFISTFFVVYLHVCMVIQLAVSMIFIGRIVLVGKRKNNSPLPPKEGLILALQFGSVQCPVRCYKKEKSHKSHLHHRKKNGSGPIEKLVRTRYFCRVNFPYHVFMKRIRTRFFLAFWPQAGLWPQNRKKKTSPDPVCCSKALFKSIFVPYHVLHVSLPCFTVVSRVCTIALLNHEPNLIVTSVNG